MPLEKGIIWSVSSTFCFQTCISCSCCLTCRFVKCPYGLYLCFIHLYEPKLYAGYTLLASRHMSLQSYHLPESEKRMRGYALKKWESTMNLRVHAHVYNVELIMR